MTDDAKFKKAIRARMAETGEKYTPARRALLTCLGDFFTVSEPFRKARRQRRRLAVRRKSTR